MDSMEPIVPLSAMESIANGIDHAEGICLTPDGTLYVSGEKGQIYRVGRDGAATEATTTGGWTLGLASDAEGRIYACDPPNAAVMRWTPGSDMSPEPWSIPPKSSDIESSGSGSPHSSSHAVMVPISGS